MTKRTFDLALASIGLAVVAPLFAIVALAIRLDSPGPVFFRQERVGLNFRRFRIFKFRTMVADAESRGPALTIAGDNRITRVGALLRRTKLDELPQLINVLVGDMSFVGPRPEVPKFVDMFPAEFRPVLTVRPGVTDPASYRYRDEGTILGASKDPERTYIHTILPDKLRLAKAYVEDHTLVRDCVVILKTLLEAVGLQAIPLRSTVMRFRRPIVIGVHLVLIPIANYAAFLLRFDAAIPEYELRMMMNFWPWLLAIRGLTFIPFRLYEGLWRYTDIWDLRSIILGVCTSTVPFAILVHQVYGEAAYPRSVYVIDTLLLIVLMGGVRLTRRIYREVAVGYGGPRVLVIGVGDRAAQAAREMRRAHDCRILGFVDESDAMVGRRIHGLPVLGSLDEVSRLVQEHRPDQVIVAMPEAPAPVLRGVVRTLEPTGVPIRAVTGFWDHRTSNETNASGRLALEDLLSGAPASIDERAVTRLLEGATVMVIGAGGTLGSELCRQIMRFRPARLVAVDRHERSLLNLQHAFQSDYEKQVFKAVFGDATDKVGMGRLLHQHRPRVVFYAAFHNDVSLAEDNPCETVNNNIGGLRNTAQAVARSGVERFVFLSSLKGVNPGGVYGAAAKLAEAMLLTKGIRRSTAYVVVRVPDTFSRETGVTRLFLDQARSGQPITVTHPDATRYFLPLADAARLVLHASAAAEAGCRYTLDAGEPVLIADIARDVAQASGMAGVEVVYTGLRPGEKLHDHVLDGGENLHPVGTSRVMRVDGIAVLPSDATARIRLLLAAARAGRDAQTRAHLVEITAMEPIVDASPERPAVAALPESVPFEDVRDQHCPNCRDARVQRSKARTLAERLWRHVTTKRLFRCAQCGWRGWLVVLEHPGFTACEQTAPNLDEIELALPRRSTDRDLRAEKPL